MIERELAQAIEKRRALGLPSADTDAYRLLHAEGDGVPGLTVDVYGEHLVASVYSEQLGPREQGWITALGELGFAGVYLKHRPRQANEIDENERRQRAPEHAVTGRDAPSPMLVREGGVPFEVRLGDGFSTGIFLDQRDNRARVAALSPGKRVLNLFAYTCGFGVVAARAGAQRTVNVDAAKNVLERGRLNYAHAGVVDGSAHAFLARDVFEALPRMHKRGERFDLVVLDPPSYATTKRGRFRVESDYPELARLALDLVSEGGTLLACLNHHRLGERDLSAALQLASSRAGRAIRELTFAPVPADHPPTAGRDAHLKSAWLRI
jgi:23S rRNA (cytosine1962-C5)-methyltransferase